MAHVRQQIRERIATEVTGLSTTGSKVFQSRVYPLQASNLSGLLIYTTAESSEPIDMGGTSRLMNRTLSVIIEAYVKAVSNYDDTVDTICSEVEVALGGSTVNGLVKDIYLESTEINYQGEGDQPLAIATMTWNVLYETASNAPDTAL
jgi:hypothetical protein|tara:strand:- start:73 stop:516 length:444 start_codon:yes stop_codon:yes gene_type:complete